MHMSSPLLLYAHKPMECIFLVKKPFSGDRSVDEFRLFKIAINFKEEQILSTHRQIALHGKANSNAKLQK